MRVRFLCLALLVAPCPTVSTTYEVDYGFFQIELCPQDSLNVTWTGRHNIAETQTAACASEQIAIIEGYHDYGYEINLSADTLLSDTPGQTRYFMCELHCGEGSSRFEVTRGLSCDETASPTVSDMTDNYCEDDMVLESGAVIETWDGRGAGDARPHFYTDEGDRVKCRV
eukprot:gene371-697_t